MTRVDFYVLPGSDRRERELLACRIAEKAYAAGHRVYVHAASAAEVQALDQLLWNFRAGSFVPHVCHPDPEAAHTPVLLGHDHEPDTHTDVLINFAQEVPLFFGRFERVVELVDQQPEWLEAARARYRFYRERGYPLESHKLGGDSRK